MDKIILNVGGKHYETTTTTLCSISDYFRNLCGPDSQYGKPSDGVYFIDRDPDLFRYVLMFARTSRLPPIVEDLEGLLVEAEYFDYERLVEYLKKDLSKPEWSDANKMVQRCGTLASRRHESEIQLLCDSLRVIVHSMEM